MMFVRCIFLILSVGLSGIALSQIQLKLHGVLVSQTDSLAITDALVVSSTGKTAITDHNGRFFIIVSLPGWIEVVHLNYTGKFDVTDSSEKVFYLTMATYDLEAAEIDLWNRMEFDQKVVNGSIPEDAGFKLKRNLALETVSRRPNTTGVELGSPITALYNQFSKEAKQKRRYVGLMTRVEHKDSLLSWLRYERLTGILGSNDSIQINCFFLYCSIDPEVTKYLNEIEVLQLALNCKESYLLEPGCDWPDDLYFLH